MSRVLKIALWLLIRSLIGWDSILCAQNLVPNPSFEDSSFCTSGITYKAEHWFSPTSGTPDIFRNTGSSGVCVEGCDWIGVSGSYNGAAGYQLPRTGRSYMGVGIVLNYGNDTREYLSVQLADTLRAGGKYCVSFYTILSDLSGYATDGIGACLTVSPFNDCAGYVLLNCTSEVRNPSGNILSDTVEWVLVSDTFVASGGERYITIGNFHSDTNTTVVLTGESAMVCYHYIDDVSVYYCDTVIPTFNSFTLYPNPSNGEFNISGNFPTGTQLYIYDMLGQKIGESIVLPEGNNIISIDLELAQGAYYYELRSPIEQVAEGKFIITE